MKKVEELCIKYLMNETDPDETADIRAEMIADSDALIEYESMRSTWSKVSELPEFTPPAHLTEAIVLQARKSRRFSIVSLSAPGVRWAAAAAVVGVAAFGAWSGMKTIEGAPAGAETAATPQPEGHWVDRNNILYIQPSNVLNAGVQQGIYQNVNKLKPVVPTPQNSVEETDIQLTGSQKPANR